MYKNDSGHVCCLGGTRDCRRGLGNKSAHFITGAQLVTLQCCNPTNCTDKQRCFVQKAHTNSTRMCAWDVHLWEWCLFLGARNLQGLTGAEAQPQVITMFFFLIFCFNLRFSDSLDSGEMLLCWKTGRLFSRFNSHGSQLDKGGLPVRCECILSRSQKWSHIYSA